MMKGHEELIAMRQERRKPGIVFVNDFPCKTDWHKWSDESVTVCTHGETLQTLDLRFLVGLRVSISSKVEQRAKQLFELVKEAGAVMVAASHVQTNKHPEQQTGWAEIWKKAEVNHG